MDDKHPNRKRNDVSSTVMSEQRTDLNNLNLNYMEDPTFKELRKEGIGFVSGAGPLNPGIMIVGEAPGHLENEKGVPFIGKSGKHLSFFLKDADINPRDVYMTNMVKYWPQDPNEKFKTREFTQEELLVSKEYLEEEIDIVNPKVVGLCGYSVIRAFFPDFGAIYKVNGKVLEGKFIPLYHPTVVVQNSSKKSDMKLGYRMLKAYLETLEGN